MFTSFISSDENFLSVACNKNKTRWPPNEILQFHLAISDIWSYLGGKNSAAKGPELIGWDQKESGGEKNTHARTLW